jgi:translocation and assembly module TamB
MPDRPMNVTIASSAIELGLIEGLTEIVDEVSGKVIVNMKAVGTGRDPRFQGTVDLADAAFVVAASGAQYRNARAAVQFATDRIIVSDLHLEDRDGDPLDVKGSLATHELKVGDLQIDAVARRFELLRNEFGDIQADAQLQLRGRFQTPRLGGRLTISDGDLNVDVILEQALFQPYATQEAPITGVDAVVALNPWERLGLDLELHVPNTLTLSGENVQVATGTPIGLGDINLRVAGDLYLYKDPGEPAYLTGSFDSVSGRYSFQGRAFEVDPTSSINFRGDLNPEIYVTVRRVISGVETRVTIAGPMREPELRLSSTPALDTADILSLIVFNTSSNELSAAQRQELAVRAGALAAGFLATPIISAIQSELGLDILQIEPGGGASSGPRITVGDEIAPGLVARFSRQFGTEAYDEVVVEYYLSRIFRLRATFSDAQNLNVRTPFLRRERAGIDLLVLFSF